MKLDQQTVTLLPSLNEQQMIMLMAQTLPVPYSKGFYDEVKTREVIKSCVKRGHNSVLEHLNISLKIHTNIETYKDYTRHRHCAFTIESTAYTKYDEPCIIVEKPLTADEVETIEKLYKLYKEHGYLRDLLLQSQAADMVMTTNIREWRYIISARGDPRDNALTKQLRDMIWVTLHGEYPFFFPYKDEQDGMTIYDTWGKCEPSIFTKEFV